MPRDSVAIMRPSDPTLESFNRRDLSSTGRISPTYYSAVFPNRIEAGAVSRVGMLMEGSQAHVVLMGISCKRAIDALQRLRDEGMPLQAAATIAHMTLSSDCLEAHPPEALPLAWPPLRPCEEQQSVWSALDDGLVNLITSAHHPRLRDEVDAAQLDAIKAPGGVSGLAHLLPLLLSEGVAKFRLGIETISIAACADPAKMAGLYPRKGTLQIGSDADIVLCSLAEEHVLKHAGNGSGYHDPYAGREAVGRIDAVYLRGRLATGSNSERPVGQYIERRVSLA
jgi:dihydropyrimidinase